MWDSKRTYVCETRTNFLFEIHKVNADLLNWQYWLFSFFSCDFYFYIANVNIKMWYAEHSVCSTRQGVHEMMEETVCLFIYILLLCDLAKELPKLRHFSPETLSMRAQNSGYILCSIVSLIW